MEYLDKIKLVERLAELPELSKKEIIKKYDIFLQAGREKGKEYIIENNAEEYSVLLNSFVVMSMVCFINSYKLTEFNYYSALVTKQIRELSGNSFKASKEVASKMQGKLKNDLGVETLTEVTMEQIENALRTFGIEKAPVESTVEDDEGIIATDDDIQDLANVFSDSESVFEPESVVEDGEIDDTEETEVETETIEAEDPSEIKEVLKRVNEFVNDCEKIAESVNVNFFKHDILNCDCSVYEHRPSTPYKVYKVDLGANLNEVFSSVMVDDEQFNKKGSARDYEAAVLRNMTAYLAKVIDQSFVDNKYLTNFKLNEINKAGITFNCGDKMIPTRRSVDEYCRNVESAAKDKWIYIFRDAVLDYDNMDTYKENLKKVLTQFAG